MLIAKDEPKADLLVVGLGALLHDIADSKFYQGDESVGPKIASDFLYSLSVDEEVINHVVLIIENISFKNEFGENQFDSIELRILKDADRLDAIGATESQGPLIMEDLGIGLYLIQMFHQIFISRRRFISITMLRRLIISMKNFYYLKTKCIQRQVKKLLLNVISLWRIS